MAITGAGTQVNPYVIYTPDDWNAMATSNSLIYYNSGVYIEFGADLDFKDTTFNTFADVGAVSGGNRTFKGTLDGKGYSIKNVTLVNTTNSYGTTDSKNACIIGTVNSAIIKNLKFEEINITTDSQVVSIINSVLLSTIENCYFKNIKLTVDKSKIVYPTGSTAVSTVVGGIFTGLNNSKVKNLLAKNINIDLTNIGDIGSSLYTTMAHGLSPVSSTNNFVENTLTQNISINFTPQEKMHLCIVNEFGRDLRGLNTANFNNNYVYNEIPTESVFKNTTEGYYTLPNYTKVDSTQLADATQFALPTDTWGYNDVAPYLLMFGEEVEAVEEEIEAEKILVEVLSTVSNIGAGITTDFKGVKKLVTDVSSYAQPIQSSNSRTAKVNVNVLSYARLLSTSNITIEKKVKKIVNTVNSSVGAMGSSTELIRIKRKQIQVTSSVKSISTSALTMSKGSVSQIVQVTSSIQPVRSTSLYSKKKTMSTQSTLGVMSANVYATFGQIKLVNVKTWGQKFTSKVSSKHIKYVPPKPIEVNVELSYSINKSTLLVEHHRTTLEVEYHKSILRHNGGD